MPLENYEISKNHDRCAIWQYFQGAKQESLISKDLGNDKQKNEREKNKEHPGLDVLYFFLSHFSG
jgi:hypothetical protein